MSKVFLIQEPARREAGAWVPKYDVTAAGRFGEVVRVLGFGNVPTDPEPTHRLLYEAFRDYDFDADFVLLLGDPVAIAMAIWVLAQKQAIAQEYDGASTSPIRALKWDRRAEEYAPYVVGA